MKTCVHCGADDVGTAAAGIAATADGSPLCHPGEPYRPDCWWLVVKDGRPVGELLRLDTSNHLYVGTAHPCWHCDEPTRWAELSFETAICPGACTDAKWREYEAALRR